MKVRIGSPNFHSKAATRKKRTPRVTMDAHTNVNRSKWAAPEAMVTSL